MWCSLPKVVAAVGVPLRAGQAVAAVVAGMAAGAELATSDAPRLAADGRLLAGDDGRGGLGRCSRRDDRSGPEQAEGGDAANDETTQKGVPSNWLNVPDCIGTGGGRHERRCAG